MYFFKKYKNKMIVTLVAIILIVTMGMTNGRDDGITGGENFLGNLFSPISKAFYTIGNSVSTGFQNLGGLFNFEEEKEDLENEIAKLKAENRDLENIVGKSDFLRKEAKLLEDSELELVSAQITSKEAGNWYNKFTIDKGKEDGIKNGDIIIQGVEVDGEIVEEGLVGRILEVGDKWSKVSSIIDEQNSISFKSIRTQDGGMIKGSIDSDIEGYLFDRKADIVVGDKLYTSGLGKGYVKDLYIGEIEDVIQLEEELMKKIVVKPAVDFKKMYKVFVIVE
ncbi:MAG: rod shape-determining protein MreC [Tissierella sp.]|uniref:rod shape-determining protein MreC n=1 Tax=Tissierella sp. TaxID=41274 RepID=UPI003F9B8600